MKREAKFAETIGLHKRGNDCSDGFIRLGKDHCYLNIGGAPQYFATTDGAISWARACGYYTVDDRDQTPISFEGAVKETFEQDSPNNLDDMSIDAHDFDSAAAFLDLHARYLRTKAESIRLRKSGRIAEAMKEEKTLEDIYRAIPPWARW